MCDPWGGLEATPQFLLSREDRELGLQLGGQAPSRAAGKMEQESVGQRAGP